MRAVQVGILAALLVCAGLLVKVYRGQQAGTPQPAQTQAVPSPAPPASQTAAPVETSAPAQPPAPAVTTPEPAKPERAHSRPSPSRRPQTKQETIAENRTPAAASAPAPATQAPAAQTTPAPAPEPAAPPKAELNPPSATPTAAPEPRQPHHVTIPSGTLLTVRLSETLSTEKNQPGDTFSATLDQPLVIDGFAIAERGSRVQGNIVDLQRAGRVKGVANIAVQLTKLHTADGQEVAISTEHFVKEGPTSRGEDAKKVGIGAALGAAIGAIAGGGKGAAIGAGVGGAAGAGTVAATRGKAAELPVETRLTFRLQQAVSITEKLQ